MSANSDSPMNIQRSRTSHACASCRARKVKCNGAQPCANCWQNGLKCVYCVTPGRSHRRQHPVASGQPLTLHKQDKAKSDVTPGVTTRGRYDLGQLKQQMELRAGIGVSNSKTGSFQFFGPSSHMNFVQRIYQRIYQATQEPLLDHQRDPVPGGLQKWGLERYIFSAQYDDPHPPTGIFLEKKKGDSFIHAYFKFLHPQIPILCRSAIIANWEAMWVAPGPEHVSYKGLVFLVLALGARVAQPGIGETAASLEGWAEYFSRQTNDFSTLFQEPSFQGLQFLLLKAMDALQAMRSNDAYLLLGHAARIALVLGINRGQVANGNNVNMHRLRVTFWIIYSNERMCSLFNGRPSGLNDDHIDVAYPEDFPLLESLNSVLDLDSNLPSRECAWIRAMADIGRLAERVSKAVFTTKGVGSLEDILRVEHIIQECDESLDGIIQCQPPYLHFFDNTTTVGSDWQEVQRIHLGLSYYWLRLIMHRPALVFSAFYDSKKEAESQAIGLMNVGESIDAAITAAKDIIALANDVLFRRFPDIRNDASVARFIIAASITLLYDVLGPATDIDYAKDIFGAVDIGIHCLDQMEHVGPTTGKTLSIDIMKCAKEALNTSNGELNPFNSLVDEFPWISQPADIPEAASIFDLTAIFDLTDHPTSTGSAAMNYLVTSGEPRLLPTAPNPTMIDPGLNYISYWLNGDIANSDLSSTSQ